MKWARASPFIYRPTRCTFAKGMRAQNHLPINKTWSWCSKLSVCFATCETAAGCWVRAISSSHSAFYMRMIVGAEARSVSLTYGSSPRRHNHGYLLLTELAFYPETRQLACMAVRDVYDEVTFRTVPLQRKLATSCQLSMSVTLMQTIHATHLSCKT